MIVNRVILQPAFVLHSRPFRDTSLLVELFTKEYGRFTVLARGVRKKRSTLSGILVPFVPLLVSYHGKTELQTLQQAEMAGMSYDLQGKVLLSGFYLNELLVRLLQRYDPHANVYCAYEHTVAALVKSVQPEIELRLFEKLLLTELGYGLELDRTISGEGIFPDERYVFEFGVGIKRSVVQGVEDFFGRSLLAIQAGVFSTQEELRDAKRLLRGVVAILLGERPLKSRELFLPCVK